MRVILQMQTEFDIPPMYDDTLYKITDIRYLEIGDNDAIPCEDKIYGSKEDFQIAMAICAIKEMFSFKQTMTHIDYFVLNCLDQRCNWKMMAHEMKDCGYYQIRKVKLDHSCNINIR